MPHIHTAVQMLANASKGRTQEGGGGKGDGLASFGQILGQQLSHLSGEGRQIETNIHQAVLGKGGLEHVAQDFAEFSAQIEAIKNLADAGIASLKQIINTPI